jgi:competence protein ComEA
MCRLLPCAGERRTCDGAGHDKTCVDNHFSSRSLYQTRLTTGNSAERTEQAARYLTTQLRIDKSPDYYKVSLQESDIVTMKERIQREHEEHETLQAISQLARLDKTRHTGQPASGGIPDAHSAPDVHLSDTPPDDSYGEYWDDVPDDQHDGLTHASGNGVTGNGLRVLGILVALYTAYCLGAWVQQRSTRPPLVGPITPTASMTAPTVVVHVAGQVHKPGVYTLPPNARVRDAVLKAGGPLRDADINAINLAAWAEDGTKIEVPRKPSAPVVANAASATELTEPAADAETAPAPTESEEEEPVTDSTTLPTPAPQARAKSVRRSIETTAQRTRAKARSAKPKVAAGVPRATTASGNESVNASPEYLAKHPLNLNRARAEQLEILPGIGPSLAQKIVDYREQNGGFKSVDDLDNVSGIGPKKLEALRPLVTAD